MGEKFKSMIRSRRFWSGIAGVVVICADNLFGAGTINPETVQSVVLLAAAWIVGDSLRLTE
jgi:glycyl-tRNA synthetase alpha subunit